jgi:hypothetical protein
LFTTPRGSEVVENSLAFRVKDDVLGNSFCDTSDFSKLGFTREKLKTELPKFRDNTLLVLNNPFARSNAEANDFP